MTNVHPLFQTIIQAAGLENEYHKMKAEFADPEYVNKQIQQFGIRRFDDDGTIFFGSDDYPEKTLPITDALMDHLNNNMDNIQNADEILSVLLDTEITHVENFTTPLRSYPTGEPGFYNVHCDSIGIALGFSTKRGIQPDEHTSMLDILEEMPGYNGEVDYLARLSVDEQGRFDWIKYEEEALQAEVPELPGEIEVEIQEIQRMKANNEHRH